MLNKHKIELTDSGHCWLQPNILLYDRPTQEWFNHELMNTSLILLGNGDISNSVEISAHSFSQSAIQKIEKSGGKVIYL